MFEVRQDEPMYALLKAVEADQKNIYGNEIDLIKKSGLPEGQSLRINGDESVGNNPNRYNICRRLLKFETETSATFWRLKDQ